MKLPRLFKLPTYKKFEYKPRTYDARMEAIRQRQKARKEELSHNKTENKDDLEKNRRESYLRDRFSEYKRNKTKKNNSLMIFVMTMLAMSILLTGFVGIGQLFLDMNNEKIIWNDLLSYSVILICIAYFLYRYNRATSK